MASPEESDFNNIIRNIIKKSLFTEQQIKIILNKSNLRPGKFTISRGAYYRQVGQSREKIVALAYTIALLRGLGVLGDSEMDVIVSVSEQIDLIKDEILFPEKEDDVINVIDTVIRQVVKL